MTAMQAKSDQKQATAKRPRVVAVRTGEKSTVRPRTMRDYTNETPFVSILAT